MTAPGETIEFLASSKHWTTTLRAVDRHPHVPRVLRALGDADLLYPTETSPTAHLDCGVDLLRGADSTAVLANATVPRYLWIIRDRAVWTRRAGRERRALGPACPGDTGRSAGVSPAGEASIPAGRGTVSSRRPANGGGWS